MRIFKKLDKLILKAFIGPFVATFFITLMVLVLQFFWLYIDDFVGKGLSSDIILEFIWYQMAVLVPLALPLAVLLSSLMTFGNLGETFELVAIKSSGISLLRFMRPLFIVTLFICGIAFLFSNYMIPVATLKSKTLLYDIVYAKPAFDLQEGVFYDKIDNYAIKVGRKENDSMIYDVIVYERNPLKDNIIVAKSGIMRASDNKSFLEFNLKDGWRYEERGEATSPQTEYIRIGFTEYKKFLDLSGLGLQQRTADSVNKNNQKMLSMQQLNKALDSIQKDITRINTRVKNEVFYSFQFARYMDTGYSSRNKNVEPQAASFDKIIPDTLKATVNQQALAKINIAKLNNEITVNNFLERKKDLRLHRIEWHRKFTLSLACLVLFMIGAPLGSIIRKGGLGTPLVIAVVFFIIFYFMSNMGEKFAKEAAMQPVVGMWLATGVLLPLGLFLTYKAMRDSQLFNKEFYFRLYQRFQEFKRKFSRAKA